MKTPAARKRLAGSRIAETTRKDICINFPTTASPKSKILHSIRSARHGSRRQRISLAPVAALRGDHE
jgi:hypothetical protein